ncbi:MAG: SAF domain-containing protein, partial [Eubacteriales bacterium]|nr:SAF domain-containing protein [Eubacteriales bacterium]
MKLKKPKIRIVIASVLIIAGISAGVFWEAWGRENIMYLKVVTANQDIMRGMTITAEMISEKAFARDTVITGAMTLNERKDIIGQVAKQNIPANGQ